MIADGLTRRHAWLFTMGALACGAAPFPTSLLAAQSVAWPSGTCTLTRRLSRGLRDGQAVVVTRSWRVTFAQQSRGVAVMGQQASVSVEAPPKLARLSQIERERSTHKMWPILLSPDGTIVAAGQLTTRASVNNAIKVAEAIFEEEGLSGDSAAQQARYLAQLQRAGSSLLDQLPGDLFCPSTTPFHDVRRVALPDGGYGEFEVNWRARAQEGSTLLDIARREVVTRIGESERRSSEDWSLVVA
ncbi:MAG: hypothetical protein QNI87_08205 [Erythrobacter sp.]|uniref:hypothetical protein n=1 Tax=Erythrobacter sp. TaxID=1042 RepID=UPI00260E2556|nr:hypothetical protein [Erythrobacter sp.]MDJ0978506.1 hypothetical protein [Erythrobacter sp.]